MLVVGLVLAALSIRAPITIVGPLVGDIRAETGLSSAAAGLLVTMPVVALGLLSPVVPGLGRRFGIEAVLVGCLSALAAGILLRSVTGLVPLFAGTVILGMAIAPANVLLPALLKCEFPAGLGAMTALYTSLLIAGAAAGSGIAVPLARTGLGWQGALAMTAPLAALAAVLWLPLLPRRHRPAPEVHGEHGALTRSWLAWQVTAFWAMQSFTFYITIVWLPQLLIARGLGAEQAGLLLLGAQIIGLPAVLALPMLAERARDQRGAVMAATAVLLAGLLGLLTGIGESTAVWVLVLGIGQGASLALALLFFVVRSGDHQTTGELAGMAQTIGYVCAAAGPLLAGLVHDAIGGWTPMLVLLVAAVVVQAVSGLGAGRARLVRETI